MKYRGKNAVIGVRDTLFGNTGREWSANGLWLVVCLALAFLWRSLSDSWSGTVAGTAITYTAVRSLFWMLSRKH
jgi:hypothetical protein